MQFLKIQTSKALEKKFNLETKINHDGLLHKTYNGAIVPPIVQTSLFTLGDWDGAEKAFSNPTESLIYSRLHNPTCQIVEAKIAELANGEAAKLYASGMGAISAAIMHYIKANAHIITIKNIYAPAHNFISNYLPQKCNVEVTYVSGEDVNEFENAIKENTVLIYLESPASVTYQLQDLKAIAALAQKYGIATIIDNTWATPIFQKALDFGIDLEVHSVSKYLNGHSDVIAGVVIGKKSILDHMLLNEMALFGAKMAPFEAFLILRGLRTLIPRLKQHQSSTLEIANYLESDNRVRTVYYPGLDSFPQKKLAEKQMTGYTGLLSFELNTDKLEEIKSFVNKLTIFKLGVSWGGHESLVYAPYISYSRELTAEQFAKTNISAGLIRISIGLESVVDLKNDLNQALDY